MSVFFRNPDLSVSLAVSGSKSMSRAGRASSTMAIESSVPRHSSVPSAATTLSEEEKFRQKPAAERMSQLVRTEMKFLVSVASTASRLPMVRRFTT